MNIFVTDLHKNASAVGEQFPRKQQTIAQVRQIGVNAQFPSIAERFDHFRFLRQILVFAVFHVALIHERLKIGAVFDPIRRVDIDHLNLSRHALFFQERVHNDKTVPGDQAVRPSFFMPVKFNGFPALAHSFGGGVRREETDLRGELSGFRVGIFAHDAGYDIMRRNGFMDMDRRCGNVKTDPLGLARPLERRVKMGIKLICFDFFLRSVMLRHTRGRIVGTPFVIVRVCFHVAHFGGVGVGDCVFVRVFVRVFVLARHRLSLLLVSPAYGAL